MNMLYQGIKNGFKNKMTISLIIGGIGLGFLLGSNLALSDSATINDEAKLVQPTYPLPIVTNNAPIFSDFRKLVEATVNKDMNFGIFGEGMGGADFATYLIAEHFGTYCAADSTTVAQDKSLPNKSCIADALLEYGDLKIDTLLSGTVFDSQQNSCSNPPCPPGDQDAALKYMTNLLDYLTTTANSLDVSTPDNKNKLAEALNDQTVLSGPRFSLAEMYARRVPLVGVQTTDANGNTTTVQKSIMQIMEDEVLSTYLNSNYLGKLSALSLGLDAAKTAKDPTEKGYAYLNEIARMLAYHNWMQYQQYRQMERMEGLLSVLVVQNFRSYKNAEAASKKFGGR